MLFSAGQEQKKTLTGCCNTCSVRLATQYCCTEILKGEMNC